MGDFTPVPSCKLQPEAVVDVWISQYKTTSTVTAFSTSLYGFNIALAISCVGLLLTHKDFHNSRRRQTVTCLYIATMICLASHAVVYDNINLDGGVIDSLINPKNPQKLIFAIFSPKMPDSLPLAMWGADAVLVCTISHTTLSSSTSRRITHKNIKIYRCIILYRLAPLRRKITLYIFLGIATIGSLGNFNNSASLEL